MTTEFQKWASWFDDTKVMDPERWFAGITLDVVLPSGESLSLEMFRGGREGVVSGCGKKEAVEVDPDGDALWLDGEWHLGRTEIVKALEKVFGGVR